MEAMSFIREYMFFIEPAALMILCWTYDHQFRKHGDDCVEHPEKRTFYDFFGHYPGALAALMCMMAILTDVLRRFSG